MLLRLLLPMGVKKLKDHSESPLPIKKTTVQSREKQNISTIKTNRLRVTLLVMGLYTTQRHQPRRQVEAKI
jgi:hypothetical protein